MLRRNPPRQTREQHAPANVGNPALNPLPVTMVRSEASSRPFSPRERTLVSAGGGVVRGVNDARKTSVA
jgi:uncharacterized protein (DUF2345 family)